MPFIGGNNAVSKQWTEREEYDPNRYKYNGAPNGAAVEQQNLDRAKQNVEGRAAPQIGGAQLDQGAANGTRGIQMGSLAMLSDAASGKAPSAAEALGRQGIDRSLRAQTSAAGNVRGGPGATAAAYRSGAQMAAQTRADMNQGIQAGRANEIAGAQTALANASTATRGQDLTAATTNAQLAQDAQKTNATNTLQGTALNDQRAAQYENLRQGISKDELDASLKQQGLAAGVRQTADQLNTQTQQKNVDRDFDLFKGAVGAGQGIISGIGKILSDPTAKEPIGGSLAGLGLGGDPEGGEHIAGGPDPGPQAGVNGTVDIGGKGYMSHDDINAAASGLMGQSMPGMVGGGGITGGKVDLGNDGTGGAGMMMSDERTKEAPQTLGDPSHDASPRLHAWLERSAKGAPENGVAPAGGAMTSGAAKVKKREELIDSIGRETADAKPYERAPELAKGVAGAPRGYASGKGAPEPDDVSWGKPETWGSNKAMKETPSTEGQAPGSDDWARYGAPSKKGNATETDWNKGGADKPIAEGKPGVFEALFGGVGGANIFGARDTTTSDKDAKKPADDAPKKNPFAGVRTWAEAPTSSLSKESHEEEARVAEKVARKNAQEAAAAGGVGSIIPALTSLIGSGVAASHRHVAPRIEKALGPKGERDLFAEAEEKKKLDATRATTTSDERTKEGFQKPSTDDMADAMRSMDPAVYAYKQEFKPGDQKPGEVNVGPMANKMAADPVARTAIVRDDASGMLAIDKTKLDKVMAGSLASLQHQIDELQGDVPRGDAKKQRRRGSQP